MQKRRPRLTHDQRILGLAFAWSIPALAISLSLLWFETADLKLQCTLTIVLLTAWLGGAFAIRERVIRPLQTASNLLAALREEDFSIRARGARPDDPLGELMLEVNALRETLREQRFGALEATALLRTVMEEIDVAIFTFDA